jgi:hypothetical protein
MDSKKIVRIAVLGSPSAERWLLAEAVRVPRRAAWSYELVANPHGEFVDLLVVDSDYGDALMRWAKLDPQGALPAAFVSGIHPRAKNAVSVSKPFTSGCVMDSLDQLTRRFLADEEELETDPGIQAFQLAAA